MRYRITIKFDANADADERNIACYQAPYREGLTSYDEIKVYRRKVVLDATRSRKITKLSFQSSSIYKQVAKAIWSYYIKNQNPSSLKSIQVAEVKNDEETIVFCYEEQCLNQVISVGADLSKLRLLNLDTIASKVFCEGDIGNLCLNAGIYLVNSKNNHSIQERFEKLWKAFNALYKAFAKENKDHDCHRLLRQHIIDNTSLYPNSISHANIIKHDDLVGKILWNKMIQNNVPHERNANGLADQIKRNSDIRIITLYYDSLPVREEFLKNVGRYSDVKSHLERQLGISIKNNEDFLATICLRYIYFIRNKIIHGERRDVAFQILKENIKYDEIKWVCDLLELIVIDLLNQAHTF